MKIACLQFSPVRGDVNNNLSRADSVLLKAADTDHLDLIVLPEMAFTGYNFASRQAIQPLLEPSLSGISSLWARTTALRHDCHVAVGYPEKADNGTVLDRSPGFYSTLMMVNPEGESLANYRKTHLYRTDETWAMEGSGFYADWIEGMGCVAMGICMDLNPYRFEAPWDNFEFANHVLDVDADVAIISMAWVTGKDTHSWSQTPHEPEMDCLSYWIARLEPLIRAETEHEILVILTNRTGVEEDMVFAGTSAVLGFQAGEVKLYGVLGCGEKGLLVVDTEKPPMGKLVYRPEEMVTERALDEEDLPGLIPNPDAAHPLSSVTSPDDSRCMSPLRVASSGAPTADSGDGKKPVLAAEAKLGVVPEQDESTGDDEAELVKEWQARMGSPWDGPEGLSKARARSKTVPDIKAATSASPPQTQCLRKPVHRRTSSLNDHTATLASSSPLKLPSRVPFSSPSQQHTRHQSLDAIIERTLSKKSSTAKSPMATRNQPPINTPSTPSGLPAAHPQSALPAKAKTAQPKLRLLTNPSVLRQMEGSNVSSVTDDTYTRATLSAAPRGSKKQPLQSHARKYPASAVDGHQVDWQKTGPKTTKPTILPTNPRQTVPIEISASPKRSPVPTSTNSRPNRPKLSIATTAYGAQPWKKTQTQQIFSAVVRPAPPWPSANPLNNTKTSVDNFAHTKYPPASAIAQTSKDQFWATANVPQTGNTEAFNLASISYTLGEVAIAGVTPDAETADTDADESWYRSPTDTRPRGDASLYPPVPPPSSMRPLSPNSNAQRTTSSAHGHSKKPRGAEYYSTAMSHINAAYPPIPSPSVYSSSSSHRQLITRPFEVLRSAEAMAEPVSWVDQWMPPPAGAYQQPQSRNYQEHQPQQMYNHPLHGQAVTKPGLNLLVPEFSNSTETLVTPSMLNPKTPKTPADNLTAQMNARRHPGGAPSKAVGPSSNPYSSHGVYMGQPMTPVAAINESSSGGSSGSGSSSGGSESGSDCERTSRRAHQDGPRTPKAMVLTIENGREVVREANSKGPVIFGGSHTVSA
ncbi:hypothetical protein BROUX41_002096 [Berkeleyomyces rouxiae]